MKRFHAHLQEGLNKAGALQQAKIDYLQSNAIYKTPEYWAHLVLTGNTEAIYPDYAHQNMKWLLLATAVLFALFLVYHRLSNR